MTSSFTGAAKACRHCGSTSLAPFCDLGSHPPSNYFLRPEDKGRAEVHLPLNALVCTNCWLSQLDYFEDASELFSSDYAYFSSYSLSWLDHAARYCDMMIERFGLSEKSFVVEVASNDGYLLKNFRAAGLRVLGVEPSANVARVAVEEQQIPTDVSFFGKRTAMRLAAEHGRADVILGNNVLAHVPDINDFISGLDKLLTPEGVVTFEFPHLENLIKQSQFDTIYHEHFSYLSMIAVKSILEGHGLRIFDVERLPTHGGSIRVFACFHDASHAEQSRVADVLAGEKAAGLTKTATYANFQDKVIRIKRDLLRFLLEAQEAGKTVAAYGAAAKGNTLLNYAGIRGDLITCVADRSPQKQGRLLPGAHIPVVTPEAMIALQPDYLLVLPWNLRHEIVEQMAGIRDHGGQFVVAIPELEVF